MLTVAVLLLAVQGVAEPQDAPDTEAAHWGEEYSDSPEPATMCDEAKTQMEINSCAAGELEAADKALNEQWAETMAVMRRLDGDGPGDGQPGHVETVRAAQRAWLTYRDQHCLAESFIGRGGSIQVSLEHTCKAYLTQQRTFQLSELTMSLAN